MHIVLKPLTILCWAFVILGCTNTKKMTPENPDATASLQGEWKIMAAYGTPVEVERRTPLITFDTKEMKANGNNGCNNFMGSITALKDHTITLGPMATTRMGCPGMQTNRTINKALTHVASYKVSGTVASLFDKDGVVVLALLKN